MSSSSGAHQWILPQTGIATRENLGFEKDHSKNNHGVEHAVAARGRVRTLRLQLPIAVRGLDVPTATRPLLAARGALIQHDAPFPSLFLPDQDTPIVIRE
jgi:hypothetical protein